MLTKEEEHALIADFQVNRNIVSRNQLVEEHLPYVRKLAKSIHRDSRRELEIWDLINDGVISLMHHIDFINLDFNVRLLTYSTRGIVMHIKRSCSRYYKRSFAIPSDFSYFNDLDPNSLDFVKRIDAIDILCPLIHILSTKEKRLLYDLFYLGKTYPELAEKENITRQAIGLRYKRIIDKLKEVA